MKTTHKYGLLISLAAGLWLVFREVIGWNHPASEVGSYTAYLGIVIVVLGLFFGIKQRRDLDLRGTISFREAFTTGFAIMLIATAFGAASTYVYFAYVNPGFADLAAEQTRLTLAAKRAPLETIEEQVGVMRAYYAPGMQVVVAVVSSLVLGAAASAVLATFLKKENAG